MHVLRIIKFPYDDTDLGYVSFIALVITIIKSNVRADTSPLATQAEVKVRVYSSAISLTFPGTMNAGHTAHRNVKSLRPSGNIWSPGQDQ